MCTTLRHGRSWLLRSTTAPSCSEQGRWCPGYVRLLLYRKLCAVCCVLCDVCCVRCAVCCVLCAGSCVPGVVFRVMCAVCCVAHDV
jgi:hypothetical protein